MGLERRAFYEHEKSELLEELMALWKAHPGLRLGQLLTNAVYGSLFYREDFDLLDDVREFIDRHLEASGHPVN